MAPYQIIEVGASRSRISWYPWTKFPLSLGLRIIETLETATWQFLGTPSKQYA